MHQSHNNTKHRNPRICFPLPPPPPPLADFTVTPDSPVAALYIRRPIPCSNAASVMKRGAWCAFCPSHWLNPASGWANEGSRPSGRGWAYRPTNRRMEFIIIGGGYNYICHHYLVQKSGMLGELFSTGNSYGFGMKLWFYTCVCCLHIIHTVLCKIYISIV